jgi:hypothetical protein
MECRVPVSELVKGYRAYAGLLDAVGYGVERTAVTEYLADTADERAEVEDVLSQAMGGECKGRQISAQVAERMQDLVRALQDEIARVGAGPGHAAPAEVADALRARPEEERERVGDAILLNGHRRFLQRRYMSVEEFRHVLSERGDKGRLALVKLVPFLQRELEKRGFSMSEDEIGQLFDAACEERQVPACLKGILREADGEFSGGLINLRDMVGDEDPDLWLERVREKLQFRSHSAMHKAVADATSLKYDCVHKALSGRKKAKRIQAEIKYCLDKWLQEVEAGREPGISQDHRGVSVDQMHCLLATLERRFATKEKIYRLISAKTGIKTGSVRRYFQSKGQLKYAPLAVYRCAIGLANGEACELPRRESYLTDNRIRHVARELARQVNEALDRWHCSADTPELEIAYRELRRALIVTMKDGREAVPAMA